ncbi:peptidase inhibitor family I36 protein [Amycolatopsis sp. NBC_00345]|uniref:peptidase inhibitor family I36 protein n=1 Tax=Amycolatopsis sp. NBC_00345 TaxID=2975955 RepID=UPI002E25860B
MKFVHIAAAVAATTVAFAMAAGPASAATTAGSAPLAQQLTARGGTVGADGQWVHMPDGTDVSVTPMSFSQCPSGWVCLWQDGNYGGRMLKWSSPGTSIAHLSDYGFNDEMSSWANRGTRLARWWVDANYKGTSHNMPADSSSAHGGDDQASSLKIY